MNPSAPSDPFNRDVAWHSEPAGGRSNPYAAAAMTGSVNAPAALRHSGPGIASFILSIVSGILLVVVFFFIGYLASRQPPLPEDSPQLAILGLLTLGLIGLLLIAAILGLVSLFQHDRRKIFGILGLIFGLGGTLLIGFLVVLGIMMG